MFRKRFLAVLAAIAGFSTHSTANVEPDFSYVEGGIVKSDVEDTAFSPIGFSISGSAVFTDMLYGVVQYKSTSDDIGSIDLDYNETTLGLGARFMLTNSTVAYTELAHEAKEFEYSGNFEDVDGNGFSLSAGIRTNVTESLELDGKLSYQDVEDDSDTIVKLAANYYFNANVAVGVSYTLLEKQDTFMLNGRYSF
ncbi:outer membrane beta-barrel protein [Alteromonas sp. ASW11-130]|uniref:outer membrane beta-barrel protein n=1 Tax=Alteromonas sp. ASW11-130 TaxID=3015775 RepID=UPI0022421088|nr:outer membrane beta-barrel protein [Alteromonas sp. ASW11-130]MCW8090459.1 porin family protein [Alteromonas sp. ASW11-130]